MTTEFLHGVEVIDVDTGSRPVRSVKSSVIGLIGTAPNAEPAKSPYATINTVNHIGAVRITLTETTGSSWNGVMSLRVIAPSVPDAELSMVQSDGANLAMQLATNGSGEVTTTVADLVELLSELPGGCWLTSTLEGYELEDIADEIIAPTSAKYLQGGQEEPFPLNTPVLVAGDRKLAAKLGANGSLPAALDAIFDQVGAMVVVVRVAQGGSDAATKANIIGGVNVGTGDYEGMQAFLGAETLLGVTPRILAAPGWTSDQAVLGEMVTIANRLRAHIAADGPNTTDVAAVSYRHNFGSRRVYIVDPGFTVFSNTELANVDETSSARVAGLIARIDNEMGFWHSPSNKEIYGNIVGTKRPVDFALGDPNCRANYLNEQEVATIIRKDGFRLWGNRTCSSDPRYAFLSVSRTADMIDDSILRAHLWAVDRNINATYIEDVVESVNGYLRYLVGIGAIIGGRCWADTDLNTPENIAAGNVYFDFDFAPSYPAERVSFRRRINNSYLEEIL